MAKDEKKDDEENKYLFKISIKVDETYFLFLLFHV